jgi:hypothetical protein
MLEINQQIEQLKQKYQPVQAVMQQHGVQLQVLNMQGDQLYLRGEAPSQEAKNRVWDAIKAIDPSYLDLIADIRVAGEADTDGQAPQQVNAEGLAAAFRSDQTPPFPQMLANFFDRSDSNQRAGLVNRILGALGPSALSSLPGLGSLSGLLRGNQVSAEQASSLSADQVKQLAEHAERQKPSIVDEVSHFYSQHPDVVKAAGGLALTIALQHMMKRRA